MAKLLTIGHTTLDTFLKLKHAELHCDVDNKNCLVCFGFGSKIPIDSIHESIGGGAANVSASAKKLGHDISIYTIIGKDSKSTGIKETFDKLGIGTDYVEQDDNPTDQSTIISYSHERTIFTYTYTRNYKIDHIKAAYKKGIRNVYLSSAGSEVAEFYAELIEFKRANPDLILFYNPGSRELRDARDQIVKLLPSIDHLLANVEEGCILLNPSLKRDQIEMSDLTNLLNEKGIKNVVLTDADKGAYVGNSEEYFALPALKVEVVEKTGAGDAFAGAYISAVLYGKDIKTAAKWGVLNGAAAIQKIGAQNGILDIKEIESRLAVVKED